MRKKHLYGIAVLSLLSPAVALATPVPCLVNTPCRANFDACTTAIGASVTCTDTGETVIFVGLAGNTPLFTHTTEISGTYQWKMTNTATAGTDSRTDGQANTTAMTSSAALRSEHPAATKCWELNQPTDRKFYLPSISELDVFSTAQRLGVTGISSGTHWSSSQHSATNAWFQNLSSGSQYYSIKPTNYSVRCARR